LIKIWANSIFININSNLKCRMLLTWNRRLIMSNVQESTIIEKLANNVVETRFENFDQETLDNAKTRILDVVGCVIGGSYDQGNPELVNLIRSNGGAQEATVLVYGTRVPVGNAALANCVMARSFDFEPVSPVVENKNYAGHVSGTTVMTAMNLSEMQGVSGKELISALVIGDDVAARILSGSGFGFARGWDNTGAINAFGATAIAGRLLRLNPVQMRNAFGIILNQLGGSLQCIWDATMTFKLHMGISARNGIFAAQLAKVGWTGPKDALNSRFGYYQLFTEGLSNPESVTKYLGKKYYSEHTIKPYSSCRGTHIPIECALALLKKHDIKAADIQKVTLSLSPQGLASFCNKPFKPGEFAHGDAAFSYEYTLATVFLKGGVKPQYFCPQALHDSNTLDFIKKIIIQPSPKELHATELKVTMKNNTEFTETGSLPSGDMIYNPITKDEIKAKFMNNIEYSGKINKDCAEKASSMIDKLEMLDNVQNLIPLLVA
jgi:2-methylcitrate dehydratase PrpD